MSEMSGSTTYRGAGHRGVCDCGPLGLCEGMVHRRGPYLRNSHTVFPQQGFLAAHGFLQLWSLGLVVPQPVGPSRTRDGTCVPCIAFMDQVAGYSPLPGWNTLRGPRQLHECALSGRLPARPPRERRISHKGERESATRPSCSPPACLISRVSPPSFLPD